eukprot:tig00000076_g2324.t1
MDLEVAIRTVLGAPHWSPQLVHQALKELRSLALPGGTFLIRSCEPQLFPALEALLHDTRFAGRADAAAALGTCGAALQYESYRFVAWLVEATKRSPFARNLYLAALREFIEVCDERWMQPQLGTLSAAIDGMLGEFEEYELLPSLFACLRGLAARFPARVAERLDAHCELLFSWLLDPRTPPRLARGVLDGLPSLGRSVWGEHVQYASALAARLLSDLEASAAPPARRAPGSASGPNASPTPPGAPPDARDLAPAHILMRAVASLAAAVGPALLLPVRGGDPALLPRAVEAVRRAAAAPATRDRDAPSEAGRALAALAEALGPAFAPQYPTAAACLLAPLSEPAAALAASSSSGGLPASTSASSASAPHPAVLASPSGAGGPLDGARAAAALDLHLRVLRALGPALPEAAASSLLGPASPLWPLCSHPQPRIVSAARATASALAASGSPEAAPRAAALLAARACSPSAPDPERLVALAALAASSAPDGQAAAAGPSPPPPPASRPSPPAPPTHRKGSSTPRAVAPLRPAGPRGLLGAASPAPAPSLPASPPPRPAASPSRSPTPAAPPPPSSPPASAAVRLASLRVLLLSLYPAASRACSQDPEAASALARAAEGAAAAALAASASSAAKLTALQFLEGPSSAPAAPAPLLAAAARLASSDPEASVRARAASLLAALAARGALPPRLASRAARAALLGCDFAPGLGRGGALGERSAPRGAGGVRGRRARLAAARRADGEGPWWRRPLLALPWAQPLRPAYVHRALAALRPASASASAAASAPSLVSALYRPYRSARALAAAAAASPRPRAPPSRPSAPRGAPRATRGSSGPPGSSRARSSPTACVPPHGGAPGAGPAETLEALERALAALAEGSAHAEGGEAAQQQPVPSSPSPPPPPSPEEEEAPAGPGAPAPLEAASEAALRGRRLLQALDALEKQAREAYPSPRERASERALPSFRRVDRIHQTLLTLLTPASTLRLDC